MNKPLLPRHNSLARRSTLTMRPTRAGRYWRALLSFALALTAVASTGWAVTDDAITVTEVADLDQPWAMAVLPDGRLLVTEKKGSLLLVDVNGKTQPISGVPAVAHGGQGGLGDVMLHPQYQDNGLVYLSYAESDANTFGAAVIRATLQLDQAGGTLSAAQVIWRQTPKVAGKGHYGHRLAFGPEGYLWISSGERQKFDPSQDMATNLGKVLRLEADGTVPDDNPYADLGGVSSQIWSSGHRNPLGMAFDQSGQLWVVEMGPKGGDELNLIQRGANYGYPIVSEGDHYDGRPIPTHATKPEFQQPAVSWTPVISPADLMFYSGEEFPQWQGEAIIAGLSAQGLVRVAIDETPARETGRVPLDTRIRSVRQAADGSLWVLEDSKKGAGGRLLRLQAR